MSTEVQLIVEDDSPAFEYSPSWSLSRSDFWYNLKSWHSSTASPGILTFTFNGTSAAFIGSINAFSPMAATVQIDEGTPFVIDYGESPTISPPTYKQWFITPTLRDGSHKIVISNLLGAAVDYAVVKVGIQSSMSGQTIIVDDDSPLIQYHGLWSRNTNKFTIGVPGTDPMTGYPYGNGTHRSTNPGDSFAFRFSGTSIAVYGILSFNGTGLLTLSYSMDGTIYPNSYTIAPSTTRYGSGEVPNYLYLGMVNLPPGTHTLLVNITGVDNKAFELDYITYTAGLDTLSSISSASGASSASSTSSASASSTTIGSHKSVSTGAIVGGVLGGVAFGALVMLLVISILRRRKARELTYAYNDANIM